MSDLRGSIDGTRGEILDGIAALLEERRIKRVAAWMDDAGSAIRPRYVYLPADRRLAHGVGFCATPGCDHDPELVVAGKNLCRACARGPVDSAHGGGQFREERVEDAAAFNLVAGAYDASRASGGWEPADGGERIPHPRRPGYTMKTTQRGARRGMSAPEPAPALTPTDIEAEFG